MEYDDILKRLYGYDTDTYYIEFNEFTKHENVNGTPTSFIIKDGEVVVNILGNINYQKLNR